MQSALWTVVAAVGAAALALMAVQVVHRIVVRLGRRSPLWSEVARHTHRPVQLVCALFAVHLAVWQGPAGGDWEPLVRHLLWIAVIGAVAWLVVGLVMVVEDAALARFRTDVPDNRQARRVHTQVLMLRRFSIAIVVVLAVAVMLTTFPQVRTVGASMLASAGLAGVVAALAAQSVPVPELREELRRLLEGNPLWDGRVCVLQLTDATSSLVRLRALASAADAPTLWDLRCQIREHLVAWVRDNHPGALPRMRAEIGHRTFQRPPDSPDGHGRSDDDAKVFSGSHDGNARASHFAGPDDLSSR